MKNSLKGKMLYFLLVIALLLSFIALPTYAQTNFQVDAKAAYAVDAKTGKILFDQNGTESLPIASMTKMLSMYLVLEQVHNKKLNWDDPVTISQNVSDLSFNNELSNVPLYTDTKYTVKQLYEASLVASANAAVMALAERIASSEDKFVDMMRNKLKDWGINDAVIVNASGLNNSDLGEFTYPGSKPEEENKMSAKDVATVAYHLVNDFPEILDTTKQTKVNFSPENNDTIEMTSWNWMLPELNAYKEGVDGLKTGTTDLAGACFTGTIEKNGQRIITVIMHANNNDSDENARFIETSNLMDHVFETWEYKTIIPKGKSIPTIDSVNVDKGKTKSVALVAGEDITTWIPKNDTTQLVADYSLEKDILNKNKALVAPITEGTTVGDVWVHAKQDKLGYITKPQKFNLKTKTDVEKANIFVILGRNIKNLFS